MDLFDNIEKQNELKAILDSWDDTPFRHHCGVKGKGTDCIHFVVRVFEEMGILSIDKKRIPSYPKDWHLHNTRELLSEGIEKNFDTKKINIKKTSLKNGDVVLSHFGRAASHAAIYFDNYLHQSIASVGICKINCEDKKFKKMIKFVYRIQK